MPPSLAIHHCLSSRDCVLKICLKYKEKPRSSASTGHDKVPAGPDWIHEIKHDGYRMLVIRNHDRVRLISRVGRDWADRFSLIVSAALKLPEDRFAIDGEVVVLDKEGKSDFDALSSRRHDKRAQLSRSTCYRVTARTSARCRSPSAKPASHRSSLIDGIFIAEYERGDIGDVLFKVACNMGSEGIVSKHLDRPYGAGRCKKHWIKIKNPAHPAYTTGSEMRWLFRTDALKIRPQ
jgi:bifunctional non-homologous end joining protein LigD